MMTRTARRTIRRTGFTMNSVDTGWVTDEDAAEMRRGRVAEHRFHPPAGCADGAARVVIDHRGMNTASTCGGSF